MKSISEDEEKRLRSRRKGGVEVVEAFERQLKLS